MKEFNTAGEAHAYFGNVLDRPVESQSYILRNGALLRSFPQQLRGRFTNVYDVAFGDPVNVGLHVFSEPVSVSTFMWDTSSTVAASAGFFYLSDTVGHQPRQTALNLAIANREILSLPVVDREAVVVRGGKVSMAFISAIGQLDLDGQTLFWAGSRSDWRGECIVYGNANAIVRHIPDPTTRHQRKLDHESVLTPSIGIRERSVDLGLMAVGPSQFRIWEIDRNGRMNIFDHDLTIRVPRSVRPRLGGIVTIQTLGPFLTTDLPDSAISVGPDLMAADPFHTHPINIDPSLGSHPPFNRRRLARMALYRTVSGATHLRLYDGRPSSPVFSGVTPTEAKASILAEEPLEWGCFLDPGQTAKLCISQLGTVSSIGNQHYLRWPSDASDCFTWLPGHGRPVSSIIALD